MVKIVEMLCPSSKYVTKSPYEMNAEGITIHNTANDATATNEATYMIRNNYKKSFHYAVDDTQIVQVIPISRNAWHAGDGNGYGNRKTIGIEICYSKSAGDRFNQAEINAAELIARIMITKGWGLDKVGTKQINTHQSRSGKYCPHRTLDNGLERFYNLIRQKYQEIKGSPIPETTPTNKEEFNMAKIYRNGSTTEPVYSESSLRTKTGSLDRYETCECLAVVNGAYLVKYKLNGTSDFKTGFCRYAGGVK